MTGVYPNVRLIVVHWNQPLQCVATIGAIVAQTGPIRITVVDNNSEDGAYDQLRDNLNHLQATLVRLDDNKGWGGALNVVFRNWLSEQEDDLYLISAHDAYPKAHCLSRLITTALSDARIGIACPQYPEPFVARVSPLRGVYPEIVEPQASGSAQEVDAPHGTLMLVRRECLIEVGLFDERYFAYGDEHELGMRAVRRGWKVAMVWGSIVENPGTWTPSPLRSYLFARNSLLLVHDYFGRSAAVIRAFFIALNTLRLMLRTPKEAFAFSSRARFHAIRDFFLGRFGRPDFL